MAARLGLGPNGLVGSAARSLTLVALTTTLVITAAAPASAAPPANDDRGDATVIGALPFRDDLDTSEATPQGVDPECASGENDPSVWYSFTPASSGRFGATTFGSTYDTTLVVGVPENGGMDVIACNDDTLNLSSAVIWNGQAGQTYLLMVGACCGTPGGDLVLRVRRDPPVPRFPTFSVAPRGTATKKGAAIVRGQLRCSRVHSPVSVVATVLQRVPGRGRVRAEGFTEAPCGEPWRVRARNRDLKFLDGEARVRASVFGCNMFACRSREVRRDVILD